MATAYDVQAVSLQIVTSENEIFNIEQRHEEGFKDDPADESSSETKSSTGEKVFNIVPDGSTGFSLSLVYGSEETKILRRLFEKWKSSHGVFSFDVIVRDNNKPKETIRYTGGAFKKQASQEFGNESGTKAITWELKFEHKHNSFDD